jgi:hypothetical protein
LQDHRKYYYFFYPKVNTTISCVTASEVINFELKLH